MERAGRVSAGNGWQGGRKQVHEMSTSLVLCACVKGAGTTRAVQGPGQPAGSAGNPCRGRSCQRLGRPGGKLTK